MLQNCCIVAVMGPANSHETLYAVTMRMRFDLRPPRVTWDHRPRPYGSVPFSITLEDQFSQSSVRVPPGWNSLVNLSGV